MDGVEEHSKIEKKMSVYLEPVNRLRVKMCLLICVVSASPGNIALDKNRIVF